MTIPTPEEVRQALDDGRKKSVSNWGFQFFEMLQADRILKALFEEMCRNMNAPGVPDEVRYQACDTTIDKAMAAAEVLYGEEQ